MMDFLEHTQKQKKDLEESMKESFRQRDERLAREKKIQNILIKKCVWVKESLLTKDTKVAT